MEKNIKKTSLGLDENVEALLAYVLGWITGIVFLILEKDSEFVRFHAMQSTITFLGFTVLSFIFFPIPSVGFLFEWVIRIIAIVVWIICMVKAYQGEKFKLPVTGELAEKYYKQG